MSLKNSNDTVGNRTRDLPVAPSEGIEKLHVTEFLLILLRKATISFVMFLCSSVCSSVSIEQIGSHWKDFNEI
jgi:hypothetical protein